MHNERNNKHANEEAVASGAVPAYLLDREGVSRAKVLSNTVKQKRKEKAGKWAVPVPKVAAVSDAEMFKVLRTGKRKQKAWKRMVTKATFVGESFTRKPAKFERFIRPSGLRFKKAHVTHPELQTTFFLNILGVKKNPSSALYTQLGYVPHLYLCVFSSSLPPYHHFPRAYRCIPLYPYHYSSHSTTCRVITKGTVIEVNVSELGLVTTNGKVVWGKYAQVTNNPELDGCINAILLV